MQIIAHTVPMVAFTRSHLDTPSSRKQGLQEKSPNDMALSSGRAGQGYSAVRNKTTAMIYLHAASNKTFSTLRCSKSVYKHDQRV